MTQISRIIVMTGLFVVPVTLAFSQEAPPPPAQPSPWRTPRPAPPAMMDRVWSSDPIVPPVPPMAPMPAIAPMAPMPPMPPMPAMAPMAPMAVLAPMPPMPDELLGFGYLAFQD